MKVLRYERLDSTNDEAKRLAAAGEGDRTWIWAIAQEQGRGRMGRVWHSPPGNLTATLLLRPFQPTISPARATELGFVAALAVADLVAGLVTAPVSLKWPNDVLVAGAKISGILLESQSINSAALEWLLVGIGLNVASAPEELPYPATAIADHCAAVPSLEEVFQRLAEGFIARIDRWFVDGFAPTRRDWLARAQGLGEPISLRRDGETVTGRFRDLDTDGALLLESEAGIQRITAGDVAFAAG